ncbi:unnamed protein product [Camellia sinensis]
MTIQIAKCLISVLIALFFVSSVVASSDAPFIVAHKKATLTRLKPGIERVSVSLDIYNQGSAVPKAIWLYYRCCHNTLMTAYDISLTDDSWSKDIFDSVSGNTSMSWERLDAGAILSHAFELESKVQTLFYGAPAVITFRVPTKAALQEAYSTPIMPLDILADRPPEKKFELAKIVGKVWVIDLCALHCDFVCIPGCNTIKIWCCKRRQEEALIIREDSNISSFRYQSAIGFL